MLHQRTPELFTSLAPSLNFQISEEDGREAVIRARNAALQMPLNHLEAQRSKLKEGDVELFKEINPIQVAHQFLAIIGDSMLNDGIEPDEAAKMLASFVERLNVKQPLTSSQAESAARKVIDIVRNRHSDSEKFTEFYHDPYTGLRERIEFQLVQTTLRADGTSVYRLTESGVKLIFLNLNQSDDFDMMKVLVEHSIKSGQYQKSTKQLDLARRRAMAIVARFNEILDTMRRLSYDKDFEDELKGLLEERRLEVEQFKDTQQHLKNVFRSAREAGGEGQNLSHIQALEDKLDEIWTVAGKLVALARSVLKEFGTLQDRLIYEVGRSIPVPDLQNDILRKIIVARDPLLDDAHFGDVCLQTLFPIQTAKRMDPFAVLDNLRLDDRIDLEEEDHQPEAVTRDTSGYSPAEQLGAHRLIENLLIDRPDGISLSELTEIILSDDMIEREMRQCMLHRAVLFSSNDEWRVLKTPLHKWIDNEYFESDDFVMKLEKMPARQREAA